MTLDMDGIRGQLLGKGAHKTSGRTDRINCDEVVKARFERRPDRRYTVLECKRRAPQHGCRHHHDEQRPPCEAIGDSIPVSDNSRSDHDRSGKPPRDIEIEAAEQGRSVQEQPLTSGPLMLTPNMNTADKSEPGRNQGEIGAGACQYPTAVSDALKRAAGCAWSESPIHFRSLSRPATCDAGDVSCYQKLKEIPDA